MVGNRAGETGPLLVSGCMDSQKAHLISELTKGDTMEADCDL